MPRKSSPLKRMKKGDFIIYYSPEIKFKRKIAYQHFTAIGQIIDDEVFQVEMFPNFFPFRRKVNFFKSKDVQIRPLINELDFIEDKKRWGYKFRFGIIEINKKDYLTISSKMPNDTKD